MLRRRILIPVIGFIFIILILVLAQVHYSSNSTKAPSHPQGLEKGSNSEGTSTQVGLLNGEQLYSHLLASQYQAVHQAIGNYVTANIGQTVTAVTVINSTIVVNYNGSLNFSVQVNNSNKVIAINLQFPNAEEIVFTIPATNYTINLFPYGSSTGSATGGY